MKNERQHINVTDAVKDALAGYVVIILGIMVFILSLAVITTIVRFVVGAGAGA